ncbi:MAG: hypothetical protein JSV19_07345 [Phycisphaerales bacterium]|nr:MAG: hypothetical protein JSV19_07345 [Phycisphaerales bacterium]
MKRLRWLLLALYVTLIALLTAVVVSGGSDIAIRWLILLAFAFVTQWLFVWIPGRVEYLTPTRPRRVLVPALIAALMMTVLLASLVLAMAELFQFDDWPIWTNVLFCTALGMSWIVWSLVFFAYARRMEGYPWVKRMVIWLLGGSLLQLLATVPSHVVVSRRPGCFVGIATALGVFGGLFVMCWAFGPGIVLLFWSETRKRMAGHCPGCGYNLRGLSEQRCPECGRAFTFDELRTTPEKLGFTGTAGGKLD